MASKRASIKDYFKLKVCATMASGFHTAGQTAIWGMSSVSLVLDDVSKSEEQPILTPEQLSWFASLPLLIAMILSTLGGVLTEYFGPRKFQLMMAPVLALSCAALHISSWQSVQISDLSSTVLIVTRFIQSVETALVLSVVCQYPCEIADSKHRGILSCLPDFWGYIGFVMSYLSNYFLHWTTVVWLIPLMTFLPSIILLLISPESPAWLVRKGRITEASEALFCLRVTPREAQMELNALKEDYQNNKETSLSFRRLMKISNAKPLAIAVLMPIFRELSGSAAITFFMGDIFKSLGVTLHPNLSSSVVGSFRALSNLIGGFILHRMPRKLLLISGAILVAITSAVLGILCFLQYSGIDISYLSYLPLILLIVYMLGYGLGIGSLTWVVSTEILPNEIRSVGCGMTLASFAGTAFLTTKTFSYLQESIGLHGIFWIYSASACSYGIFTAIFIPETSGCSLFEIQTFWENK